MINLTFFISKIKKMKTTQINLNKLFTITVNVMLKHSITDLACFKMKKSDQNNIWNVICFEYLNSYDNLFSKTLYNWWHRDTNKYNSIVKNRLSFLCEISSDKTIIIEIESEKWIEMEKNIGNYNNRKTFKVHFHDFLSQKVQENGINCWLKCKFNWFRSREINNFWNGTYYCIQLNCKNIFKAKIFDNCNNFQSAKTLIVKYSNYVAHSKIKKPIRCTGNQRKDQARELVINGTSIVQSLNTIHNELCSDQNELKVVKRLTLSKIKSELVNKNRISTDIYIDLEASKTITDGMCLKINSSTSIIGYLHDLCLNPFGFLMISDIQCRMWTAIKKSHSVWYFDATGTIHKDISKQNKPFLYSIVGHDHFNKCIIPFAEFVTTGADQNNIAKFLLTIKNKLEHNSKTNMLAQIVVTDFGWALMNAVLLSFNNCNMVSYLNWCFILCTTKSTNEDLINLIKTRLYLCSTHFLKSFIKKTEGVHCSKQVKRTFIYSFTLVQNSDSMMQIDLHLFNIFNIFNNKYFDESVITSIKYLASELRKRNLGKIDIEIERLPDEKVRDSQFNDLINSSNIFIGVNHEKSIKESSPFTEYYKKEINKYKIVLVKNQSGLTNKPINEYYCPDLFYILEKQLYLIPVWSGLMLRSQTIAYKIKTRLTNNPVENWFSQIKNNFLKRKRVATSELVTVLYLRLLGKFYEHFYDEKVKEEEKKQIFNAQCEKWKDKNEKMKRDKGIYYQNKDIFKTKMLLDYDLDEKIESDCFKKTFEDFLCRNSEFNLEEKKKLFDELKLNQKNLENKKIYDLLKYSFIKEIESNRSYEFLSKEFKKNKKVFESLVSELRLESLNTLYKGENYYLNFKEQMCLSNELFPILSKPDGNCLYNSISKIILKDENYFFIIKLCSIFVMLEYEHFFTNLMKHQSFDYTYSFKEFIEKTVSKNEWSTELNIISIMILLNRSILCYFKGTSGTVNRYRYDLPQVKNKDNPIRIGIMDNHFFPLFSTADFISELYCNETDFLALVKEIDIKII